MPPRAVLKRCALNNGKFALPLGHPRRVETTLCVDQVLNHPAHRIAANPNAIAVADARSFQLDDLDQLERLRGYPFQNLQTLATGGFDARLFLKDLEVEFM